MKMFVDKTQKKLSGEKKRCQHGIEIDDRGRRTIGRSAGSSSIVREIK
jgi:hypothetical protein